MVLICNDRSLQKMKPLYTTTFSMAFRRYVLGRLYDQKEAHENVSDRGPTKYGQESCLSSSSRLPFFAKANS